ncbi:serine/threonine-protein kinase [Streptosporangium fragile]|uniref:non-specific serine/threonine protein kinase n=1 Tax=Streptosporangium fragile TaxID=46186 RepID=A0ABN3W9I7_9ACTN
MDEPDRFVHMPEDPSHLLAGRHRLLVPLGEGGMGRVWRARDELLHQTVAVKEVALPARLLAGDRRERLRRTLREARMAARMRGHPGIVTIYDVVEEDDRPWIVMELVEGPSLAQVIRAERRLPETRVARIGLQVIAALTAAHAAGVVHRDVKPANILIKDGPQGDRAVLTDFGISAAAHDTTTPLTGTGQLLGTPAYLAPEQINDERASPACDLWAVGVTLYEAVEGRRPFARESTAAVIAAIISRPPAPVEYADRLRPAIEGLLSKDPAERLTAAQVTALLTPVAAGVSPVRRPADAPGVGDAPDPVGTDAADRAPDAAPSGRVGTPQGPEPADGVRSPDTAGSAQGAEPADGAQGPDEAGGDGRTGNAAPGGTGLGFPAGPLPAGPAAPDSPPPGQAALGASRRPRMRVAVAAGTALAAVATAAAVFWTVQSGASGPTTTRTPGPGGNTAAASGSGRGSTASTGPEDASATGSNGGDGAASTGAGGDTAASPAQTSLPRGFTLHRDTRGFSVAIPDGWTKEEKGIQVTWTRRRGLPLFSSSWTLGSMVDSKRKETREPAYLLDQIRDELRGLGTPDSYRELSRRPVPFTGGRAAELEYTFTAKDALGSSVHVYSRCVVRDSGGLGILWFYAPGGEWAEAGTHVDTFIRTFRLD